MRIKTKRYIYAGMDFIFDRKLRPFFLEANRSAQGLYEYKMLYGSCVPARFLAEFINSHAGELAMLVDRRERNLDPATGENVLTAYSFMREYLTGANARFCYARENRRKTAFMTDRRGNRFVPGVIIRWDHRFNHRFEANGVPVINSEAVCRLVRNKMKTYEVVGDAGIRIPQTFLVRNTKEAISRKKEIGGDFVLKPVCGTYGKGVRICRMAPIRKPCIIQERIVPRKHRGNYWDARVYVVNGRYIGGFLRVNKKPVTNLHRGGKAFRMPLKLMKSLEKPSLKAVRAIERKSESILQSG